MQVLAIRRAHFLTFVTPLLANCKGGWHFAHIRIPSHDPWVPVIPVGDEGIRRAQSLLDSL